MTLEYRVIIEGEPHDIRVESRPVRTERDLEAIHRFAITTAWLEHYGHLPRGVVNAVD